MAGSLWKVGKNKWKLCVSLAFDLGGKRIRKYKLVEAKGKRAAEKLLAEFILECEKDKPNKTGTVKFKDFFPFWLQDYAEIRLRKKTISRYKTLWPRVEKCLGNLEISTIRPTHLIQFYNILQEDGIRLDGRKGGLSATTVRHHHTLISTILETAVMWELINSNPCSKVKLSRIGVSSILSRKNKVESIYTIEETIELLEKLNLADIKYKTFINLAIFTGARREEILGLEWSDINFETCEIKIQRSSLYTPFDGIYEDKLKNFKSKRNCYIPKEIMSIVEEYNIWWNEEQLKAIKKDKWNDTNRLFIKRYGEPMHPDTPSKFFNKFLKEQKLKHTCLHNLRHVHCSLLVATGMDINKIADQMGHADLQMIIKNYSHNMTKNSKETAEQMKKILLD